MEPTRLCSYVINLPTINAGSKCGRTLSALIAVTFLLNIYSLHNVLRFWELAEQERLIKSQAASSLQRTNFSQLFGESSNIVYVPKLSLETLLSSNKNNQTSRYNQTLHYFTRNYLNDHKQQRIGSTRYLLYWALPGGIGDQLLGLVDAYWTAVVSRRILLIDKSRSFLLSSVLTSADPEIDFIFDRQKNNSDIHEMYNRIKDFVTITIWSTNSSLVHQHEKILLSNHKIVIYNDWGWRRESPRFAVKNCPPYLTARDILGMRQDLLLRRVVLSHIFRANDHINWEFRNEFERLVSIFKLNSIPSNLLEHYVAVHARIGEGVKESGHRFDALMKNKKNLSRCLAARLYPQPSTSKRKELLFLATDSPEFRPIFIETIQEMYGGRVKVFYTDWDPFHLKRAGLRTKVQNLHNVFLDLRFLGCASRIIALRSGFPHVAQAMGTATTLEEIDGKSCLARAVNV